MPPLRLALYAATAAVLALTGYSVVAHPPSLFWALAVFAGYASLMFGGVFVLRWRVFVDALVRAPRGARGVALTFDDGPHPRWTLRVLDLLAERGAHATFFLMGRKAEAYPEVVRAILERGHSVGLHSYAHDRFFALRGERRVREDLERGIAALEKITGRRPALFRPPIGHTNPVIARVADSLDLVVVGWTIAGRDGVARARPDAVAARVRRDLCDGAIVLLHDAPERGDREPAAVRALPAILDAIFAERLDIVPVSRWVADSQAAAAGSTT
jgi:peptidoglycan/xylan/chitin deacetylase (PgdA/CDA1 family)